MMGTWTTLASVTDRDPTPKVRIPLPAGPHAGSTPKTSNPDPKAAAPAASDAASTTAGTAATVTSAAASARMGTSAPTGMSTSAPAGVSAAATTTVTTTAAAAAVSRRNSNAVGRRGLVFFVEDVEGRQAHASRWRNMDLRVRTSRAEPVEFDGSRCMQRRSGGPRDVTLSCAQRR